MLSFCLLYDIAWEKNETHLQTCLKKASAGYGTKNWHGKAVKTWTKEVFPGAIKYWVSGFIAKLIYLKWRKKCSHTLFWLKDVTFIIFYMKLETEHEKEKKQSSSISVAFFMI